MSESTTSTTDTSGAKLRLVQLLLAKASDEAATPAESETFMQKATELMAKYGIEQAMVNAAKPAGQRETVTTKQIVIPGPYSREKGSLLYRITEALGMKAIRLNGRGGPGETVLQVFGFPSDIEQADMLFASLTLQAVRDVMREEIPYYEHKAAFRRTFLEGFNSVVGQRLTERYRKAEREAQMSTPGTDLVLVDRRKDVDQAFATAFPRTRNTRRYLSGSGGSAGRAAGRRADIGGTQVGGSRTALGR